MKYQYKLLNYWNDQDDLYVNYTIENLETNEIANCINYYNTSDIGCDYNSASEEVIENSLYRLIEESNGLEFNMPKVSELSPLLKYVYLSKCLNVYLSRYLNVQRQKKVGNPLLESSQP